MVDAKKIRDAVALMDRTDDKLWNENGSPKIETLRLLLNEDKLNEDDVDEAIGALKRTDGDKPAAPQADAPAVDPTKVDPARLDPDTAKAVLDSARQNLATVSEQIQQAEHARSKISADIDAMIKVKDGHAKVVDKFAKRVSFAESVKAIQAQTAKRLAEQKDQTALAAAALKATGTHIFASKLDASMANRKRTPEQSANYAKFVHQNAAAQREARG